MSCGPTPTSPACSWRLADPVEAPVECWCLSPAAWALSWAPCRRPARALPPLPACSRLSVRLISLPKLCEVGISELGAVVVPLADWLTVLLAHWQVHSHHPTGGEPHGRCGRPSAPARHGHEGPQPAVREGQGTSPSSLSGWLLEPMLHVGPCGRRWPPAPLCRQCGAPLRGPRCRARPTWPTQLRVDQRSPPGRRQPSAPGFALRQRPTSSCCRASLRDIRPAAERRLPLNVR